MKPLDVLEERVSALEAELAERRHPLAEQHRYELSGQLRALAEQVNRMEARLAMLTHRLDETDDGDSWKRT